MRRICTRPLIRAETWEKYTNKKGGISYKVEFLQRDFYDQIRKDPKNWKYWNGNKYRKIEAIPCGKCIECMLNYSRQWATDLMLEKLYHEENTCWFGTLTYDDEHLPVNNHIDNETGEFTRAISLNKKDMRDFWKRVRWFYRKKNTKIVYLNVGEYGTGITSRPHYHFIVFGLPLDESKLKKIGSNTKNDPLFTHPDIVKLWGKGNIVLGRVTWQSCAYVARYTLKKINGQNKQWNIAQGRVPEFVSMSQGIGKQYYLDHWNEILTSDSVPINNTGAPKRFLKMLKEINPEAAEHIKRKRKSLMEYQEAAQQTDLNEEAKRNQRDFLKNNNFKDIRRN